MSITVTSTSGQKLVDAKVVLDNKQTSYTNIKGIADFSVVSSGVHSIVVTQTGNKPTQEKVTLTPGENETLTVKLTSNSTNLATRIGIGAAIAVVFLLAAGFYLKIILKRKDLNKHFPTINSPFGNPAPPLAVTSNSNAVTSSTDTIVSSNNGNIVPSVSPDMPVAQALPTSDYDKEIPTLPKPTIYPDNS